jgi:hypothetical protein
MRRDPVRTLFVTVAAVVGAIGLVTGGATAASTHRAKVHMHHGQVGGAVAERGAWAYDGAGGPLGLAMHGPYYGWRGIPGEACDLPTSACPNWMRDGQ